MRRGTHATKTRGLVSGTGKKPYKQKGTGRAQVGSSCARPLWRKGGTVFGPQPRSYEYAMPKKQERGALREALAAEAAGRRGGRGRGLRGGREDQGGGGDAEARFGANGPALVVDVKPADTLVRAVRNIPGDGVPRERAAEGPRRHAARGAIIATRAAVERLQEVLGS